MMKTLKRMGLATLLIAAAGAARAQSVYDSTTTNYGFIIPGFLSSGWVNKVNDWVVKLDTGAAGVNLPNVFVATNTFNAPLGFYSRSISQLQAIVPAAAGRAYYCNNCSPLKLVISTGTSAGNFADAAGGAFK